MAYFLSPQEVTNIIKLLATDMTITEIAARTGHGRSTILAINRRYQVRDCALFYVRRVMKKLHVAS